MFHRTGEGDANVLQQARRQDSVFNGLAVYASATHRKPTCTQEAMPRR